MTEFTEDMLDSTDLKVTHEMEVSELGEAGIPMQYEQCKKYPGHMQFIPVENFNMHHLPEPYRTSVVYDCIKYLSQMTVRIDVNFVSQNRPDNYLFGERKGRSFKRYGTGRIDHLMWHKGEDKTTCSCLNCKQSDSPSKHWMEVFVMTAKHVVYDNEEAENTCCKLFYDNERSAEIILSGISVDYEDKVKDRCLFKCATCDPELMKQLDTSMKQFEILWKKAYNKYKSLDVKRKLICIVSHPHGHFKRISIGHALRTVKNGKVWFQFVYSTPTCPGSSGAATFVVGHTEHFFYQHIHSHSSNNFNYSGLAW